MEETMPLKPTRRPEYSPATSLSHLPESPRAPMEFLSRSWSSSALQLSKALAPPTNNNTICMASSKSTNSSSSCTTASIAEDVVGESEDIIPIISGNQFSFASSVTSQLVLDRIMSQSMREEVSPLTSGRLSHSSGPLNGGSLTGTDSPPVSPSDEFDDVVKFFSSSNNNAIQPLFAAGRCRGGNTAAAGAAAAGGGSKTVGRWLKDRKERKKEESRAQNAQIHAAISVAAVASAVAAITAATAATSASAKNEHAAKTDAAVASAATLIAAQCAEAAESMGADRDHLAFIVSSAVNVRSYDDIATLTAAAATALRGVATLKARVTKEVWNIAAVTPVEKGTGVGACGKANSGELWAAADNSSNYFNQEFLARGTELLKRTRKGDLHWKIVSVYLHRSGQVMLKMKSKHVAGTITKKKKNVVFDVCKNVPAWPGRHLFEGGEKRRYFGLRTENRGVVEFECRNQNDYELWTRGVSSLLSIVAERKNRR